MSRARSGGRFTSRERRARRLEQRAVRHARRTRSLARAAAEAAIDVRVHRWVVERELAFHQRAHEVDASTRRVVLVSERDVRRTRLEAEAAVHARIDPCARSCERSAGNRARGRVRPRAHATSPRMPRLRMRCGSKASRTARESGSFTRDGNAAPLAGGKALEDVRALGMRDEIEPRCERRTCAFA